MKKEKIYRLILVDNQDDTYTIDQIEELKEYKSGGTDWLLCTKSKRKNIVNLLKKKARNQSQVKGYDLIKVKGDWICTNEDVGLEDKIFSSLKEFENFVEQEEFRDFQEKK